MDDDDEDDSDGDIANQQDAVGNFKNTHQKAAANADRQSEGEIMEEDYDDAGEYGQEDGDVEYIGPLTG